MAGWAKMAASDTFANKFKPSVFHLRMGEKKVQSWGNHLFNFLSFSYKMSATCSRLRRDFKKQHNKIKNRIKKALDSSLELRTSGSFTTFIVEGKLSWTGVESTNTTSGSYANLMERLRNEQLDSCNDCTSCSFTHKSVTVLFQGKCHI